jgi:outer membrane biosynthesis protein TonB
MNSQDDAPEQPDLESPKPKASRSKRNTSDRAHTQPPVEPAVELAPEPILDDEEPEPPPTREAPKRSPEPWHAEEPEPPPKERASRLYRFGRKLLDRSDDVKELASTLLDTGDRAKSEAVRMVAREVRNYLDELKLKEDLVELIRDHSLEMKISIHLKPLVDSDKKRE